MRLLVKWERPILSKVLHVGVITQMPEFTQRGDFTLDVDDDLTINQIRHFALLEINKTKLREREVPGIIKLRIEL